MRYVVYLDGWKMVVPWQNMQYGDSFFIPTANPVHDKKAVRDSAREAGVEILVKLVIENGVQGVRVWCVNPA